MKKLVEILDESFSDYCSSDGIEYVREQIEKELLGILPNTILFHTRDIREKIKEFCGEEEVK